MTPEEFLREQSFSQKIMFVGGPWDGRIMARPMGQVLFKWDVPSRPSITTRLMTEGDPPPDEMIHMKKHTYELVTLRHPVRYVYYFESLLEQLRKFDTRGRYPYSERENDVI